MLPSRLALLMAGMVLIGACIDPAEPRPFESELHRRLVLLTVLEPDSPPALIVTTTAVFDTTLAVTAVLDQAAGFSVVAGEHPRCPHEWASAAALHCLRFELVPQPQQEYTVRVTADGHEDAEGSARVPGDFKIISHEAIGQPPGSESLAVEWSPSAGAHRYLVAIRAAATPRCFQRCLHGWSAYVSEPRFQGVVPEGSYAEGEGPWTLEVYALERNLFDYLTTGTSGDLFSVAKASNVSGGYGVVGAWVRQSITLGE